MVEASVKWGGGVATDTSTHAYLASGHSLYIGDHTTVYIALIYSNVFKIINGV